MAAITRPEARAIKCSIVFLFLLVVALAGLLAVHYFSEATPDESGPSVKTLDISSNSVIHDDLFLTSLKNALLLATDASGKVVRANVSFTNITTVVINNKLQDAALVNLNVSQELQTLFLTLLGLKNAPLVSTDSSGTLIEGPGYNADGQGSSLGNTQLVAYGSSGQVVVGEGGLVVAGKATFFQPLSVEGGGTGSNESLTPWCVKYGLTPFQEACLPIGVSAQVLTVSNGTFVWTEIPPVTVQGTPGKIVVSGNNASTQFNVTLANPLLLDSPLDLDNGGTGSRSSGFADNSLVKVSGNQLQSLAAGETGQLLLSNGVREAPSWSSDVALQQVLVENLTLSTPLAITSGGTNLSSVTPNAIFVGSVAGGFTQLTPGTNGSILMGLTDGDPYWVTSLPTEFLQFSFPLNLTNGGTGTTELAAKQLLLGNGTGALLTLPPGLANQVLVSGEPPMWEDLSALGVTRLTGTDNQIVVNATNGSVLLAFPSSVTIAQLTLTDALAVSNGGTGSPFFVTNALVVGNGSDPLAVLPVGTNGTVLAGSTGSQPLWIDLTLLAVTQLTGTPNQIQVNASQGPITLSFPDAVTIHTLTLLTPLAVDSGGSGKPSHLAGSILLGNGTNPVGNLPTGTSNQLLIGGSNGPEWADISSVADVAVDGTPGQIDVSTVDGVAVISLTPIINVSSVIASNLPLNQLVIGGSSGSPLSTLPASTSTELLLGGFTPTWTSLTSTLVTSLAGTAAEITVSNSKGDITLSLPSVVNVSSLTLLSSTAQQLLLGGGANGVVSSLAAGASNQVLTGGTTPVWVDTSSVAIVSVVGTLNQVSVSLNNGVATLSLPSTVAINTLQLTTPLSVSGGGVGTSSLLAGALLVGNDTGRIIALPTGTTAQMLIGGPSSPEWVDMASKVVTFVAGSPNGIDVSASQGSVVFSLPSLSMSPV